MTVAVSHVIIGAVVMGIFLIICIIVFVKRRASVRGHADPEGVGFTNRHAISNPTYIDCENIDHLQPGLSNPIHSDCDLSNHELQLFELNSTESAECNYISTDYLDVDNTAINKAVTDDNPPPLFTPQQAFSSANEKSYDIDSDSDNDACASDSSAPYADLSGHTFYAGFDGETSRADDNLANYGFGTTSHSEDINDEYAEIGPSDTVDNRETKF